MAATSGRAPAECVSRAPRLRLLHEARAEVGEGLADPVGVRRHDDHRPRDAGLPHERDRIADQRLSPQQVQDLGPARPHALALARGEDRRPTSRAEPDGAGYGVGPDGLGTGHHGAPRGAAVPDEPRQDAAELLGMMPRQLAGARQIRLGEPDPQGAHPLPIDREGGRAGPGVASHHVRRERRARGPRCRR